MVDFVSGENSFLVKRLKRLDLPTPESPMRTTKEGGERERKGERGMGEEGRGGGGEWKAKSLRGVSESTFLLSSSL